MKKGGFNAVVLTRGVLITVAAALVAFIAVFIGVRGLMSGVRLAIGQRYVMRAVADTSGIFYPVANWEDKDGGNIGIQALQFVLGIDVSSPQSAAANVSANISALLPKYIPVIARVDIPKATSSAPALPSNSPSTEPKEPTETPAVVERESQIKVGNSKGVGGVSISNETDYGVDINAVLAAPAPFKVSGNGPQVLIVHTHTTESYAPSKAFQFTHSETDRTTDTRYSMARVGDELAAWLEKNKVLTIHDKTIHDYPEYVFAYNRAYSTIISDLAKYPSIKIIIDLHRDAIFGKNGEKYKITDVINNEKVAQVMTVVGTNQLGLKHDNWRTNLKFAVMLQQQFVQIHPSFARPINLRTARFNGHTAPGAVIIEVGSSGNTLDEALASCKHIAKAISGVIQQLK